MSMPLSLARDPFLFADESRETRLRPAQQVRVPDPIVRTILFSATRSAAIVDGRTVGVGDAIGSLKVLQIERDAVVFAGPDGQQRRVPVHRSPVLGLRR
jgi:hypothetical protein